MRHAFGATILGLAFGLALTAAACGGGGSSPTSPSGGSTGGGGGGGGTTGGGTGGATTSATITISSAGVVSPSSVTIVQGGRVTFVNNDSRNHDMSSDPHPEHTDCPPMEQVGFMTAGQTKTSGNFNTIRTCGFHDHNQPSVAGLQGRIVIVAQ
jgi:plastocyanin